MKSGTITAINDYEGDDVSGYVIDTTTDQTIKLYIDNSQSCCEQWGFFWCNDDPQEFVGATVLNVSMTDTALNTEKVEDECNYSHHYDDGNGIMFVNIETDRGVLQFVAYNCHNGYYGHEATVECSYLTEKVFL